MQFNTKRIIYLLLTLFTITSCINKEPLGIACLPVEAQLFLNDCFPEIPAFQVENKQYEGRGNHFFVPLTNGTNIFFNMKGRWQSIEEPKNEMPESVLNILPTLIISYVMDNYPYSGIRVVQRYNKVYTLSINYLSADSIGTLPLKLKFDSDGVYLEE